MNLKPQWEREETLRLHLSRGMARPERGRRDAPNLSYPNEVIGYLYFFGFPIKTFGNDKAKWIPTIPDEFIGENQGGKSFVDKFCD